MEHRLESGYQGRNLGPMSEKSKARTLRRRNQQDKKKLNNCFLTEERLLEKDLKRIFLNPNRKRLEHKPK